MSENESSAATKESTETQHEISAAEIAKLRRERRQARILAGGTERLNKITKQAHDGGSFVKDHKMPTPSQSADDSMPETPSRFDDPPDVIPDLASPSLLQQLEGDSTFPSSPSSLPENPILKFLASGQQQQQQALSAGLDTSNPEELFQNFFKQALGGEGSGDGDGMDPIAALLQGMAAQEGQSEQTSQQTASSNKTSSTNVQSTPDNSNIWRITHAIVIIGLSLFAVQRYEFAGTEVDRTDSGQNLAVIFRIFTALELLLQTSRFIIEKGRSPSKSIFTKIAAYLPPPYSSYLILAARYTHIITNVMSDFSLLVFILGLNALIRG
ncbi:hypothetical protein V1511DRAFT_524083 [Dipodascopsis uninucleata]